MSSPLSRLASVFLRSYHTSTSSGMRTSLLGLNPAFGPEIHLPPLSVGVQNRVQYPGKPLHFFSEEKGYCWVSLSSEKGYWDFITRLEEHKKSGIPFSIKNRTETFLSFDGSTLTQRNPALVQEFKDTLIAMLPDYLATSATSAESLRKMTASFEKTIEDLLPGPSKASSASGEDLSYS